MTSPGARRIQSPSIVALTHLTPLLILHHYCFPTVDLFKQDPVTVGVNQERDVILNVQVEEMARTEIDFVTV